MPYHRTGTKWTVEEDEQLRQELEQYDIKTICRLHARSKGSIMMRLVKLNKQTDHASVVTEEWSVVSTPTHTKTPLSEMVYAPLKDHTAHIEREPVGIKTNLSDALSEVTITDSDIDSVGSYEEEQFDNCIMVCDTETTGKDIPFASVTDSKKWEKIRLVQFAYELYTENHEFIKKGCWIIRPDGFTIPKDAADIHGITTELALEKGVPIEVVFTWLDVHLPRVATIVAHHMKYDDNVIQSELFRYQRTDVYTQWKHVNKDCTMLMGKRYLGRNIKLAVLAEQCGITVNHDTLHEADADTAVCAEIYFFLLQRYISNQSTIFTISHDDRDVFKLLGGQWDAGQKVWTMDQAEPYYTYALKWFMH
jgi:DNA polymerase III epsilon subunit-like protein